MATQLDSVDRGILHMLQRDARNITAKEMAEKTGVSPSTVRNRIDQLEVDGVISGYYPMIDYEQAGLPIRVLFVISAPPTDRSASVEKLMEVQGIVDVRETLAGAQNLHVEAVAPGTSNVRQMTERIHDLGLHIDRSELLKQHRLRPFNHFQPDEEAVDEDRKGGA